MSVGVSLMMQPLKKVAYYRKLSEKYGLDLLFFAPDRINWEKSLIWGLRLFKGEWERDFYDFPKAVYNRCYPEPEEVIRHLASVLGAVNVFNSITLFDKWSAYELLQKSPVAPFLPSTYQFEINKFDNLLNDHGTLILKPRQGQSGFGIYKVEQRSLSMLAISSRRDVPMPWPVAMTSLLATFAPPKKTIVQQFVPGALWQGNKFDVRILVQKDSCGIWTVSAEMSRIAPNTALITNYYDMITHPNEPLTDVVNDPAYLLEMMAELSMQVAHHLDGQLGTLAEMSVDFIVDKHEQPWIIEVNGKPDKSLFWQLHDEQVSERIYLNPIRYQYFLINQSLPI